MHSLLHISGLATSLVALTPRPATATELLAVHTQRHVDNVGQVSENGGGETGDCATIAAGGAAIAVLSAGGVVQACMDVLDAKVSGSMDGASFAEPNPATAPLAWACTWSRSLAPAGGIPSGNLCQAC